MSKGGSTSRVGPVGAVNTFSPCGPQGRLVIVARVPTNEMDKWERRTCAGWVVVGEERR